MERMDAVGDIANANTLLHAKAARSVITSLNATAEDIDAFHLPLGVESDRERLDAIPLREAIRSPELLKTAGKEVGAKGAVVAVGVVAVRTRGKILSKL